ncbi:MAG: hypothetical protein ABJA34_03950 [Pseudonocardiales bacterium]
MSETSGFPFDPDVGAPAAGAGSRRRLLLFVAAGVLILAALGYYLAVSVLGGTDPVVPAVAGRSRLPDPGALAAPSMPNVAPKTFSDVIGRDPFGPLVTAPAAGAAAAAPAAPAPTAIPAPGAAGATGTTPGMTTFKVLGVSGNQAIVSLDTKKYTVTVGATFATAYKLLKTSGGSCAAFAYGEMRFDLCEGQTLIF